jgi:hypothetical protein
MKLKAGQILETKDGILFLVYKVSEVGYTLLDLYHPTMKNWGVISLGFEFERTGDRLVGKIKNPDKFFRSHIKGLEDTLEYVDGHQEQYDDIELKKWNSLRYKLTEMKKDFPE